VPGCLLVPGREELLAVVAAEQEREAGEIAAERIDAIGLAPGEAGEGCTELIVASREPVVQELKEFSESMASAVSRLMLGIMLPVSGVVALAAPLTDLAVRMACGWRRTGSRCRQPR
jgi:hypothetical protein